MVPIFSYAYEHSRSSFTDEAAFEKSIIEKGKSYASLKSAHNFQNSVLAELTRCLRAYDVEVRVVDFKHYDFSDAEWSDLIMSVGGDGTFLSAASKILSRDKVIVGLNSRPVSSEGSLCTANWWYQCIPEFIDRLMLGKFRRFWRQRIRLQLAPYVAPLETQHPELINIHNISLNAPSARTATKAGEAETPSCSENRDSAPLTRTLPIRALNEVFVSTCMSASPEAPHMGYAVRDLVENNVFKFGHPFGFAYKIKLISRMADGYLSIDGGLAVPFNDGTPAELSINPEDAVCVLDMPLSETKP
nr:unnamed protein product [Spirometra erinaceieuropaei]